MKSSILFFILVFCGFITACTKQGPDNGVPPEPQPTVDFSFTENSTGDVTFATTSTGKINTYSWDFGDQQSSAEVNPVHSFNRNKAYSVSLKVKGPGGEATTSKLVEVKNVEGTVVFWSTKLYTIANSIPGTSVVLMVRNVSPAKNYAPGQYLTKAFTSAPACNTQGAATFKGKDGDTVLWRSNGSYDPSSALSPEFYGEFTFVGRECKSVKIE